MTHSKLSSAALAVGAALSLAACQQPAPPPAAAAAVDTAKIADAVKADAQQLVADFNAKDAVKATAHDAPDYVGMFHGAPNVVGPAQDLELTKQQVADPAVDLKVSDESVDVAKAGDMAVYRSTYAYSFTDPKTKRPTTETGNWLLGYKAQPDGSWKIAWGVVSDTPAPAPAAPAAK
jgi:ketosteroid isomerase-like protein